MRKYIVCFVFACVLFIMPKYAHADTVMPSNETLEKYGLTNEMVNQAISNLSIDENKAPDAQSDGVSEESANQTAADEDNTTETEETRNPINDFNGMLYLNKGFTKRVEPTFAQQKILSGEGNEGTSVLLFVYHNEDEEQETITYESQQAIGASGIYSENFGIEYIGVNYVLIYVTKDDMAVAKIYELNRKEQETKDKLESFQYNAAKDKESQQKQTPKTVQEILQQLN